MDTIVVDACCLINMYAAQRIRAILQGIDVSWSVPRMVLAEASYARSRDDQGEIVRIPIDMQSLVDEGLIQAVDLATTEEIDLFVRLAAVLDDGEAMALAIAKRRGWLVATDDRKARRVADDLAVGVLTTPEIVRRWSETASLSPHELVEVLHNITFGACFVPAGNMPEYGWWMAMLNAP